MVRLFLTRLDWFSSLFPRIPVPIQIAIDKKLAALKHATSIDATPKKTEEGVLQQEPPTPATQPVKLRSAPYSEMKPSSSTNKRDVTSSRRSRSRSPDTKRDRKKERYNDRDRHPRGRSRSRSPKRSHGHSSSYRDRDRYAR